jgi:hypothetical protein
LKLARPGPTTVTLAGSRAGGRRRGRGALAAPPAPARGGGTGSAAPGRGGGPRRPRRYVTVAAVTGAIVDRFGGEC